jgi:signal transduction histidine kinase
MQLLLSGGRYGQFRVEAATSLAQGLERIGQGGLDLVLLDLSLPDSHGYRTFRRVVEAAPDLAVIVLSGLDDEPLALRLVHEGAQDYFMKGQVEVPVLARSILYAVERKRTEVAHARSETALRASEENLRRLALHLDEVREEERARISRDLHDQVGQLLTGLRFDIKWIERHFAPGDLALGVKTQEMVAHVDSTLEMVRALCADLRPRMLDDLGLAAAVEWQLHQFQSRTGIRCELAHHGGDVLDARRALSVFRILQEALTNVSRHSGATRVEINLRSQEGVFELEIRDNGLGMEMALQNAPTSLGLIGMRERAQAAGGSLVIASEPGRGTALTVRLEFTEGAAL